MPRENVPHVGRPFDGSVRASQMNDVFQQVANFKSMSVTRPLTLTSTAGGGVRLGIQLPKPVKAAAVAPAISVQLFKIVGGFSNGENLDGGDYLVCNVSPEEELEEGEEQKEVLVAKPWFLRGRKTWHNVTRRDDGDAFEFKYVYFSSTNNQKRWASLTSTSLQRQVQVLIPSYKADDLITAVRTATGVFKNEGLSSEEAVKWLDLNVDGRMWAEK